MLEIESTRYEFKEVESWQLALNDALQESDWQIAREKVLVIVSEQISFMCAGLLADRYFISQLLEKINEYLHSKDKRWGKRDIKIKMNYQNDKAGFFLIYHDYKYKYNPFKYEVDLYDNGVKILTYKSEWVKANVRCEVTACNYALKWFEKQRGSLIEKGYPITKKE